mmetsp:Transcript_81496/g.209861  ORF Transcript_81496/g.209861 Transcript_81496/m.209861 type:complete len:250 (-) Transcript_81496:1849-2598(-)
MPDQLQHVVWVAAVRRSAGRRDGRRCKHQVPHRPGDMVVPVLHGSRDAVQRGREDLLAAWAEVRLDAGGPRGPELACGVREPEQVAEARGDLALVGDRDLRDILDHAGHGGRDPRACCREGHRILAAAESHLRAPTAPGDAQGLGLALVVVHHNMEICDEGRLVPRFRGRELHGDEVELVRWDDALRGPGTEGHLRRQVLQRIRRRVSRRRIDGRQDAIRDARIPRVGEHGDLVGPLAQMACAEAHVAL